MKCGAEEFAALDKTSVIRGSGRTGSARGADPRPDAAHDAASGECAGSDDNGVDYTVLSAGRGGMNGFRTNIC
ncbi:MAG: hypothetical protein LBU24_02610 [Methanocalculaceae archaeon]|nr:hypothetical protein [Methanocalculaceae archaeon]